MSDAAKDQNRLTIYFSKGILEEIRYQAKRQDRTVSWLMQQAWRMAQSKLALFPAAPGNSGDRS